jgi:ATP-binding cassette, subfamily B, heavy metal transporter
MADGKKVSAESGSVFGTLVNLWPYMWPDDRPDLKSRVFWATVFLVIAKLILVLVPYFFKWATDALNDEFFPPDWVPAILVAPVALVIAYNVVRVVQLGFNQLRDALFARVGQHAVRQLARKTFVHMHDLSLRFHLERRTGGLSRIIERGVKGIEGIVRFTILNTVPTILEFALVAVIFAFAYGWIYVAIIAVTLWLYTWFTVRASDWRIVIRREMNDSDTEANTKAIDSLLNYETVKYFNNERMEADRFDRSMERYEAAATKTWTSLGWLNFGQGVIFGVGMAAVMALSAWEVTRGTHTLGDFVFINAMLMQLSVPLNFIGFIYREIRQGITDIEKMFELLGVPAEVRDRPGAGPLEVGQGTVRFDDVQFSYDANRRILKGISFEVPAGRTVAIVGPSGAGKSTISRLLFRFYEPQSGSITIDGQNIADVTQESLRARSAWSRRTRCCSTTPSPTTSATAGFPPARKRSTGRRDGPDRRFIRSLPDGYRTMVGERGLKLSGGEKQRVAIARTILKAPPILILDEATSALDTQTEQEIQAALDTVSRGRTTIVIAHRLSTVVGADEIIVLQDGAIAERGRHAELLDRRGLYAAMWDRQREATEAEERLRKAREDDEMGIVVRKRPAEVMVEEE